MKKQPATPEFFKLFVTEDETEATMMLYGLIGKAEEYDYEKGTWVNTGTTDVQFASELARLEAKVKTVHVRINSVGGSMLHGLAIVNSIRNSKAEIHTWNDGMACSMAADIWLAGKVRHMAKNALLMVHNPMNYAYGNAAALRSAADTLDKLAEASVMCMAESTGKSEEEIRSKFYADAEDHWLTYADCEAEGFLSSGDDYTSANPPAAGITKMGYADLMRQYTGAVAAEKRSLVGQLFDEFRKVFSPEGDSPKPSTNPPTPDMNFQDFQKSLADGTLDREAVLKHLGIEAQPGAAPQTPPAEPAKNGGDDEFQKALAAQNDKIAQLTALMEKLAAQPGAGKTLPIGEKDPGQNNDDAEYHKRLAAYGNIPANAVVTD